MKKLYILLLTVIAVLFLNSCVESEISFFEDAEKLGFTGSEDDIIDFITQDAYNSLLELGVPINTGGNPPNVEGAFRMDPNVLERSNVEGETFEIGDLFADTKYYFSNQDLEDLSIGYYTETIDDQGNIISTASGVKSFISGSGNKFTIIVRTEGASQGSSGPVNFVNGVVVSGTLNTDGVQDMKYAFVIIEKTGDVNDEFIDEGEGRLFRDEDGFSFRE